jgi:hypothetical protein
MEKIKCKNYNVYEETIKKGCLMCEKMRYIINGIPEKIYTEVFGFNESEKFNHYIYFGFKYRFMRKNILSVILNGKEVFKQKVQYSYYTSYINAYVGFINDMELFAWFISYQSKKADEYDKYYLWSH